MFNRIRQSIETFRTNIFLIILGLLQMLSLATTLEGIHSVSGSWFIAVIGCGAVQLAFSASWHELLKVEQETDGKRKSFIALTLLGICCLSASGFFSSIGFYKQTKLEDSKVLDLINHNANEIEQAKTAFSTIKQQTLKNFDAEIVAKMQLIETKNSEIKSTFSKRQIKALAIGIKAIETEIQTISDTKANIVKATYSEQVNNVNEEQSSEIANAIETIKIEAEKIAATGKVEITPDYLTDLTYQKPQETSVESSFFQKIKTGDSSVLVVFLLGFGIDFASILALFANRRTRTLENSIVESRNWLRNIFNAFRSKKEGVKKTNTIFQTKSLSSAVKEAQHHILLNVIDQATNQKFQFKLKVPEVSENELLNRLGKVRAELTKHKINVDTLSLPDEWKKCVNEKRPIVIEIEKNVNFANKGHSNNYFNSWETAL